MVTFFHGGYVCFYTHTSFRSVPSNLQAAPCHPLTVPGPFSDDPPHPLSSFSLPLQFFIFDVRVSASVTAGWRCMGRVGVKVKLRWIVRGGQVGSTVIESWSDEGQSQRTEVGKRCGNTMKAGGCGGKVSITIGV